MDKDIAKEIKEIWDKLDEISRKVSKFYDDRHAESQSGIKDNSEGLFDIAEVAGENSEGMFDLAEMVADIEERLNGLEEQVNG